MRACPICARDNRDQPAHPYSQAPWELKVCAGCGLLYLVNPPGPEALKQDFAWEKTWAQERNRRKGLASSISRGLKALFQTDKLSDYVRRYVGSGRVLDVGCSDGWQLERLPSQFVPFGIEISDELARRAQERFSARGGRVIHADAVSALAQWEPGFFDGVVMSSYLEHEPSPRPLLEAALRAMRPGASLIVKVPNLASWNRAARGPRWCGYRFPDHVNYFTPALLVRLLKESGYDIRRFGPLDHIPTSDNMWLIAARPGGAGL